MDEPETPSFFRRYRVVFLVAGILVLGGLAYLAMGKKEGTKRRATVTAVNIMPVLPPPPTPPPTPPPSTPPPEPENPQQPEFVTEEKPAEPEPAPPDDAPEPLGTNLQGEGPPDGFGLSGRGGNGMIGGTGKGSGSGGSKWGWYAGKVQSSVMQALRNHRRTRSASLNITVRIWADATGRVTKATLANSTGDAALDQAIREEILTGLQLDQAPPNDMPMPIVMRITARRPN